MMSNIEFVVNLYLLLFNCQTFAWRVYLKKNSHFKWLLSNLTFFSYLKHPLISTKNSIRVLEFS